MKRCRDITITEDFRRQEKSGKQNLGWRKGWENLRQNCGTTLPNIVTAYLVSPSGEKSPTISLRQGSRYQFEFPFDGTRTEVEYRLLIENDSSQLIFFRFRSPAEGIWKIGVEALGVSEGEFHIWLPLQEFLEGEVYFLEADPNTTLTEPASTEAAITAAFYDGEDKSVAIHSGRGYTRGGFIKPDLAAPGVDITGLATGRKVCCPQRIQRGGRPYSRGFGPHYAVAGRAAHGHRGKHQRGGRPFDPGGRPGKSSGISKPGVGIRDSERLSFPGLFETAVNT